eukprot:4199119-Pleurochrysis_carterae.AAC.1
MRLEPVQAPSHSHTAAYPHTPGTLLHPRSHAAAYPHTPGTLLHARSHLAAYLNTVLRPFT